MHRYKSDDVKVIRMVDIDVESVKKRFNTLYDVKGLELDRIKIKEHPEDFVVEEIISPEIAPVRKMSIKNWVVLEKDRKIECKDFGNKYLIFVLQKRNWDTFAAIKTIAKRLRVSWKRFGFAGTKDKVAITTQLVSGFNIRKEDLSKLNIKDIKINGMWYSDVPVQLGDLIANRFTVVMTYGKGFKPERRKELPQIIPNLFGIQRFGNRYNNHIIGYLLLKGMFKEAVLMFLTDTENERNTSVIKARDRLKESGNYSRAVHEYPRFLRLEHIILHHLAQHPRDYIGALRKLPKTSLQMFVHSLQSYIFNVEVLERMATSKDEPFENEYMCATDRYGFPDIYKRGDEWLCINLIGKHSRLNESEENILDKLNLSSEDFSDTSLPELETAGSFRPFYTPVKEVDRFTDGTKDTVRFILQSGSYGTIFLKTMETPSWYQHIKKKFE